MEQTNSAVVPKQGWSWGALMFNAAFLIGAKRYQLLLWYLLMLIPIVNLIFAIVFAIYLGVKGHMIAAGGTQFANQSEYDGYVKGLDHAGKVVFFATLIFIGLSLVLAIVGFSLTGIFTSGLRVPPSVTPYGR